MANVDERAAMTMAIEEAATARTRTSPNPWVGAVVLDRHGAVIGTGATQPPGGAHAEVGALVEAGDTAAGGTLVVTLEPCSFHGRTPPCVDAIAKAGVTRVVVGIEDPDPRVAGRGIDALREAGIDVEVGVGSAEISEQLAAYIHQRRTGRPYVVCKLAASLDGGIAAPDGSSQWITGIEARTDAHRLRAESDAILVGAATVRADDPALTVRHVDGPDPRRIVLGRVSDDARVKPCTEWVGDEAELLDELGSDGVLQLMIEGGATVVRNFHERGLIDRYVVYLAPALFAGRDQLPLIAGPTAATIDDVWRGDFVGARAVGPDLRVDLVPARRGGSS